MVTIQTHLIGKLYKNHSNIKVIFGLTIDIFLVTLTKSKITQIIFPFYVKTLYITNENSIL